MNAVDVRRRHGPSTWLRTFGRPGWPLGLGLAAALAGLLMLAAGLVLAPTASTPAADPDVQDVSPRGPAPSPARHAGDDVFDAPRDTTQLDDVAVIFAIAAEHGITLGAVDYRTDAQSPLPILVRTLDIRLAEDYPKFKPFVSDLLSRIPHLYLREIRIDRGSVETSRAQITLKLSLVYRTGDTGRPGSGAAVLQSPGSAPP